MRWNLLERLCASLGPPGAENPVSQLFYQECKGFFPEVKKDHLGNLVLHFPGSGPKVLLDAHLDEVAFMVTRIEPEGFLRVLPLGGIDPRAFYAQRVLVLGKQTLPGVVTSSPPHLKEEGRIPDIEDLLIDVGLPGPQVKELVNVGDYVLFAPYFQETAAAVMAKALDDRVGLFVILEALREIKDLSGIDLWISATAQEEVGLRGAWALAGHLEIDTVVALEGTLAHDLPGVPAHRRLACCGKGPEIRLMDGRFIAHREFSLQLAHLAAERQIPHQIVVKRQGTTNATAWQNISRARRVAALAVPVRYLHSATSVAFKEDIENTCKLLVAFLQKAPSLLAV